jgi:hypothetical protein
MITGVCVEVAKNSTVQRIGYSATDSILSVSYINEVSYCTPGLPYLTTRLDISLKDFNGTYQNKKTENEEVFPLKDNSKILFDGEIGCNDACTHTINFPSYLPDIEIRYINEALSDDILIRVDTNGQTAGEYKIW